jgi:hypothetical protein
MISGAGSYFFIYEGLNEETLKRVTYSLREN